MSKNLKRMIALVLVLAVSISTFAMLTAQGYSATINGWSSNVDARYTWFTGISDTLKKSTRTAMEDELKFQNDTLGFRIGTHDPDGGTVGGDGGTDWDMSNWGYMVIVEIENRVFDLTDNTGNPWGDASRVWGAVVAPFPNMAFTIKGEFAEKYPAVGNNPPLSNQFEASDGSTVQVFFDNVLKDNGTGIQTVARFPGSKNGADATNNLFRNAVARYNQLNKRGKRDKTSYHAGYPAVDVAVTDDNVITYQTLVAERGQGNGTAIIAAKTQDIKEGKLESAYVIPAYVAEAFLKLGNNYSECFAITGAPIAEAANGMQRFENGVVSSMGFKKSSNEITSFSFSDGVVADIDNEAGTINAYVSNTADLSKLTPTITHTGVSISPEGAQDFSKTVKYTVTAESGDTRNYNVTVHKLADTDIASFEVFGVTANIDRDTNTITALVDSAADLRSAAPVITTVGTGTTITPASGATTNLSGSWEKGVTYKVTKGSNTSTYTVKVRNKSTDTSIVKFNIPKGQLKYQTLYGEVVGKISGTTVDLMYESYNTATAAVVAKVELAEGATISPDPTDARNQNGTTYTVTAEDGKTTATYTVRVSIDPSGKLGPKDITLEEGIFGDVDFSNHDKKLAIQAMIDEYNNQRTNLSYDPGDPSGIIESWDNELPIRQFFDNGSSTQTMFDHTAAIMMNVAGGRAYTLKGQMLSLWQSGANTEDGVHIDWLFRQAGGAVVNEFQMDGATYQQFASSYGKYGNGQGMTMNGVGTAYNRQIEALKDSYYYYQPDNSLLGKIDIAFLKGYEYANLLDHNPGIALDGNFNVIKLDNLTEETIKKIETTDTKGNRKNEEVKKAWPNYVMYQVFSGSGPTDATTRDSSNKTVIIKGGNINGVDHGGSLALFGDIKAMYEALPGEKQTLEFRDGNGGTGNVVDSVEYNVTLGTPKYYGVSDDNEYVMEFASDAIEIEEEIDPIYGTVTEKEVVVSTEFYYTAPVDDPTNLTYHEGNRFSSNNRIASASVDVEGAEVYVMNGGDLVKNADTNGFLTIIESEDPEAEDAHKYERTQIVINYPAGTFDYEILDDLTGEIDDKDGFMSAIQFTEIVLEDELATITYPEMEEGATEIPALDCSASGRITITAESTATRTYSLLIYQDRVPMTYGAPEWGSWWVPDWHDNGIIYWLEDGTPVYGENPNEKAGLLDENSQPLWIREWYYMDSDNKKVVLDVPNDWNPNDKDNGWVAYREAHNLGVLVS